MRPKIGLGTGWGRGAFSGGAAPPATPGGDEFTTFLLDTALDGSQPWTWHWIAWNSYALDANGDVAWKAHSDGGNFDGAPTPAEMGVVLHEVTGSGTVKLYGRQNPQPTQFPSPNFPYPYIGGMITSELSHWQTYGTWECRARLKSSKGHHWAMWMLQKDGEWPPEIDIVEIVNDGTVNTLNRIFMTPHGLGEGYVPSTYHNGTTPDVWDAGGWVTLASEAAWQDWHIYKFVWSPAIMEWWIDGVLRISRPNFVNQPMYFLITPEIGNNWAGIPDGTTVWPMEAEIDYVRISSASTSPSALSATKFINAQMFHGGSIPRTITAEKFVNEQLFYSLATLAAPVTAIGDGALQSAAVEPINTGLVFCLGSHPTGSALLGTDLVSGNPGTLLTSGSLAGVNTSHGTWRCLESTSLTNGGAHFPNTSQLRSITTQRTFAFHGSIDAFGSWAALISVPYAAGTWVQPWMAHSFRRQSTTGANLNTHVATGGTGYASVNSAGGFSTGEHWFAVTVDGAAGVARFYVDGVQVGGDVGVSTATVSWGANQPVVIFNRSNSSPEEGTDGRCYTAAIWNRVLSQTELASLVIAPQRMFASGGPVTLVATKHVNAQAFGSHTLVAAGTIQLVATKFVETQVFRSHIITQSGGAVGPLEPIDGSALAVAIDVGTSPRQAWIGYGWGANGHDPAAANYPALNTHVQKLCEEMGATVIRFHTPEDVTGFSTAYLNTWNLVKNHGIDVIFASSYIYRTAHSAGNTNYNITGMASGINTARANGFNPSHLFACTIQNEPDGHADNHIPSGGLDAVRAHQETLRAGLNPAVRILGLEWRHPQALSSEFDNYNANDIIPGTVADGCMHYYDDGINHVYYDQRWLTKGRAIWSTETGDNSSPKTQAQFIAGLNHGKVVEIAHIGIGGYSSDPTKHQLLVTTSGERTQWWYASSIISKHLQRGVIFRKCLSTDRPTNPNMPETQAAEMIWDSATNPCAPRQLVGCGRRTDGRWVLVAINYAFDTTLETTFSGGHYGAITQQLTVTIPELSTVDRVWSGQRASRTGSTTNVTVNMRTGIMRFTLSPAETIAITMDAA